MWAPDMSGIISREKAYLEGQHVYAGKSGSFTRLTRRTSVTPEQERPKRTSIMRGVGVHLRGRHGPGVVCTEANKGLKATTVHSPRQHTSRLSFPKSCLMLCDRPQLQPRGTGAVSGYVSIKQYSPPLLESRGVD